MTVYILTALTFALGCGQTSKDESIYQETSLSKSDDSNTKVDTGKITLANNHSESSKNRFDSLIKDYINRTNNKLIRLAIKDKISEEWMFDKIVKTDTANYFVFQIGHDIADTGDTNKRFITDDWVYIDSLTKRIYEYDLENDSLTKWNK